MIVNEILAGLQDQMHAKWSTNAFEAAIDRGSVVVKDSIYSLHGNSFCDTRLYCSHLKSDIL